MVVVYHGILPYDRSRHIGLMEAYARRSDVVYVDPDPGSSFRVVEAHVGERLVRATMPRTLVGGRYAGSLNRWLGMRRVLAGVRRRAKEPVLLVAQQPNLLPTLKGLRADVKVYEVRDDYAGFALDERAAGRLARAHERMLRESDGVWAISQALVDDIRPVRADVERTYVGVECDEFARATWEGAPPSLRELPRPRIGLVGNLNDRVDWDLIEGLARRRPDWHVALVGPVYHARRETNEAIERLQRLPNVVYVGSVARTQLPATMAALDVGLIPYRITQATSRINPLKLYQYLATGIPVVATPIAAIAEVNGAASIASTLDDFVSGVRSAIASRQDARACAERRRQARAFDWQVVADRQLELARKLVERAGARV
jgi:glycosyltransferase involved in cell wall biosynthesis